MSEHLEALIAALAAVHHRLAKAPSLPGALAQLAAQVRVVGHRLEGIADAERPTADDVVARRVIEPDLGPLCDRLARCLGPALSPTTGAADEPDAVQALAADLVMAFERQLGPAMWAYGVAAPRYPIPWTSTFDAAVHRLVERGRGPDGVIIAVERAGREAQGGRLEAAAWVVVGSGA